MPTGGGQTQGTCLWRLGNNVRMAGFRSATIDIVTGEPRGVTTGLLVVPVFEDDDRQGVDGLDAATGGEWSRASMSLELTGKPFETLVAPLRDGWGAARVLFVGAGAAGRFTHETACRLAVGRCDDCSPAPCHPSCDRVAKLAGEPHRVARTWNGSSRRRPRASCSGSSSRLCARRASPRRARSKAPTSSSWPVATLRTLQAAADRGRVLGECANDARLLANEPSNVLTPRVFAERACGARRGH